MRALLMRAVARVWTLLTEGVGLAWLSSFGSWLPLVDGGADNVGERGDRSLAVGAPPHWRFPAGAILYTDGKTSPRAALWFLRTLITRHRTIFDLPLRRTEQTGAKTFRPWNRLI